MPSIARKYGGFTFKAVVVLLLCMMVGQKARTQDPPEPTIIQLAKPVNTINSARLRLSPYSITPSRGLVRVLDFDGTRFVPTQTILPVVNLRLDGVFVPQFPVVIGFVNERWVILSRP